MTTATRKNKPAWQSEVTWEKRHYTKKKQPPESVVMW